MLSLSHPPYPLDLALQIFIEHFIDGRTLRNNEEVENVFSNFFRAFLFVESKNCIPVISEKILEVNI